MEFIYGMLVDVVVVGGFVWVKEVGMVKVICEQLKYVLFGVLVVVFMGNYYLCVGVEMLDCELLVIYWLVVDYLLVVLL